MNVYIIQWLKKDKKYSFLSRLRSIKINSVDMDETSQY